MGVLETEHGIFTENKETGQSAEEVYQEFLDNMNKPPQPTTDEKLKSRLETLEKVVDGVLRLITIGGMNR